MLNHKDQGSPCNRLDVSSDYINMAKLPIHAILSAIPQCCLYKHSTEYRWIWSICRGLFKWRALLLRVMRESHHAQYLIDPTVEC